MQLSSLKATDANPFAEKQGAYGKAWAKKNHGNELVAPCLREIIAGLETWLVNQNEIRMKNLPLQ